MSGPRSDDAGQPPVESLTPAQIAAVADRLAVADGFEQLVYRECEIDALWSLADIALAAARREARPDPDRTRGLARVRDLIAEAHDLVPDGETARAAGLLRQAGAALAGDRRPGAPHQ